MQFAQALARLTGQANEDAALQAFYNALQNALFGADLAAAGAGLPSPYSELWEQMIEEVRKN